LVLIYWGFKIITIIRIWILKKRWNFFHPWFLVYWQKILGNIISLVLRCRLSLQIEGTKMFKLKTQSQLSIPSSHSDMQYSRFLSIDILLLTPWLSSCLCGCWLSSAFTSSTKPLKLWIESSTSLHWWLLMPPFSQLFVRIFPKQLLLLLLTASSTWNYW